ncbi:MAG: hypothetical protein A3H95_12610 [Acidobacteria bacterium RIFCSPLOWO2_02_FULL_64_15]|nr:MAG: hypothetical protein A3H95_12610 [Acidobacteria bacterium RIFCSPLOWO2_02_FULL_64_15]
MSLPSTQAELDELVERRLTKQQRKHTRELLAVRDQYDRQIDRLRTEWQEERSLGLVARARRRLLLHYRERWRLGVGR